MNSRSKFITVAVVAWVVLLMAAATFWLRSMPVRHVSVAAEYRYLSPLVVQSLLEAHVSDGLFGVNLSALAAELEAEPGVRRALVRRNWPDGLVVRVKEHRAVAHWVDLETGRKGFLNSDSEVVWGQLNSNVQLPVLTGQPERSYEIRQWFDGLGKRLQTPSTLSAIKEDMYGNLDLSFASGVLIRLGHQDMTDRVARLMRLLKEVVGKWSQVKSIDLRYKRAAAVSFYPLTNQTQRGGDHE